jgi:hypothetical protein
VKSYLEELKAAADSASCGRILRRILAEDNGVDLLLILTRQLTDEQRVWVMQHVAVRAVGSGYVLELREASQ